MAALVFVLPCIAFCNFMRDCLLFQNRDAIPRVAEHHNPVSLGHWFMIALRSRTTSRARVSVTPVGVRNASCSCLAPVVTSETIPMSPAVTAWPALGAHKSPLVWTIAAYVTPPNTAGPVDLAPVATLGPGTPGSTETAGVAAGTTPRPP
ncbi:hypothetical protein MRX96_040068 [Rhipicephalus microplus]